MKRKFAFYFLASTVLAAGTAGGIQVFGQSGTKPNRQPNNGPAGTYPGYQAPIHAGPLLPSLPMEMSAGGGMSGPTGFSAAGGLSGPGGFSAPGGMSGPGGFSAPGGFPGPMPGMVGYVSPGFTVVNKDGRIERIEKEPGTKLSKEEVDQINETRQKVQSAVSQMSSPDGDESKRKDAKELIAKYLKAEFQADQQSRREQVERLEKQVEQLKNQLSKRDESQDKLIELRLQLLENDASGLSFPQSWGNLLVLPPMNGTFPTYSINRGMQPSIPGQTYYNPGTFSPSRDVGKAIIPAPTGPSLITPPPVLPLPLSPVDAPRR